MADFFKGLAGGFGTGLQFGQAMRERDERERLREAMGLTPQEMAQRPATPEELGRAQAETQRLATQDAAEFGLTPQDQAMYAPQMPVEGQMRTAQYGLGGQTFSRMPTQQEIEAARYSAAANVIAERDPAAAMRMRQEQVRMQRENELFPLQKSGLELGLDKTRLDLQSGQLSLTEAQRIAAENQSIQDARAKLQTLRKDGPLTAAVISSVAGEFKLDPTKFLQAEDAVNTLEIKDLKRNLSSAALKGEDGLNKFLADKFDPDKTDNITPKITKARDGSFVVTYGDRVLSEYGSHRNMMSLVGGVINMIDQNPFATLTTLSTLETQAAARDASRSTVGLNNARTGQIRQMNDALATNLKNSADAKAIQAEFAALDDDNDPGGAKRQSLITQFNMLSVKAGGTIPVGSGGKKGSVLQTPVELKKNDDGTYTAFSKDGGRALYNTFNGEEIPLGMEVDTYRGMKANAQKNGVGLVTGEENGRLVLKFVGPDGKYYDDAEKAKYAKPTKSDAKTGGLDTSRTPVVQPAAEPTAPTPKPVRAPGESFTEFRDRTVAWDKNRMAYEQMLIEQRLRGQLSGNAAGLRRPLVDQPVR